MRKISTVIEKLINESNVMPFFLVSISDMNLYLTTLQYDVTMSDGHTYLSDGGLIGVDPPRLSNVVDRESYKISISDTNFEYRTFLEQGAVGSLLVVTVGFLNASTEDIIDSAGNAVGHYEPLTDFRDTVTAYKGIIDNHNYNIDFSNNEVSLTIEGSSPLADLDLVRAMYTSKDQARRRNQADSSMDEVYKGSGEISLKWGKA